MIKRSKTAKSIFFTRWLRGSAIAVALAAACMMFGATTLKADCGIPAKYLTGSAFKPSAFVTAQPAYLGFLQDQQGQQGQPSVVGLWHVRLSGLFQSLVQFHSDGLEAESADQNPINPANYCMGVWRQHGNIVEIYHIAWLFSDGSPIGYAVIKQRNTLSSDGNSYSGTYEFIQYQYETDSNGNITGTDKIADFPGTTEAHRVGFHHPFGLF